MERGVAKEQKIEKSKGLSEVNFVLEVIGGQRSAWPSPEASASPGIAYLRRLRLLSAFPFPEHAAERCINLSLSCDCSALERKCAHTPG